MLKNFLLVAFILIPFGGCATGRMPNSHIEKIRNIAAVSSRNISATVVGPDGAVLLLNRVGNEIILKQCDVLAIIDKPEDCRLLPGSQVTVIPDSQLNDHLINGLREHGFIEKKLLPNQLSAMDSRVLPRSPEQLKAVQTKIQDFIKFYCKSLQADTACNLTVAGTYVSILKVITAQLNHYGKVPEPSPMAQMASEVGETDTPTFHYINSRVSERTLYHLLMGENLPVVSIPNFVTIPAGSFTMGSSAEDSSHQQNEAQVTVHITHPFEIQTAPVTQLQWFSVMGTNPSHFANQKYCPNAADSLEQDGHFICSNLPVESVSWQDVQDFLQQLNVQVSEFSYRLPTEAEWEYAVRAGHETNYFFGDDPEKLDDYAWYSHNSGRQTHPVCTTKVRTNPWGLCDAHGNVWEWVSDWYAIAREGGVDPKGPGQGTDRVFRGGGWNNEAQLLRSASRDRGTYNTLGFVDYRAAFLGIRLIREPRREVSAAAVAH